MWGRMLDAKIQNVPNTSSIIILIPYIIIIILIVTWYEHKLDIQGVFYDDPFLTSSCGRNFEDIDLRFFANCRRKIVSFYMQHEVIYSLFFLEKENLKRDQFYEKCTPVYTNENND